MTIYVNPEYQILYDRIHEYLEYRDEGLYWKKNPGNWKTKLGNRIGHTDEEGYRITRFNKKSYKEHQLVFLYHHGYIPELIDHINRNKSDNRIENLREYTKFQNCHNRNLNINNKVSGHTGIIKRPNGKWHARINIKNKRHHLGTFNSIGEAIEVRKQAEIYYGVYNEKS